VSARPTRPTCQPQERALTTTEAQPTQTFGGPPTRRPFGHTADRSGVVEHEAAAVRQAAQRVLAGETLSSIVRDWNRAGLTTSGGGPWRVNSLSSLLVQPRLVAAPAILDPATHAALLALHASRSKGPRRATRRYLLTGLLRCWRCGGALRGMPRARGADLYVCPGPPHGGCSGTAVTADHAEEAVGDMVLARLDAPDLLTLPAGGHDAAIEVAGHQQRLRELGDLWAAGELSRDEWLSLKRNIGRRTQAAEAELARWSRYEALRTLAGQGRSLRQRWPALEIDERRQIVQAALEHVVVLAAEPPRQVFRAERLQPCWLE
jgi:site-specific DNA recombinase